MRARMAYGLILVVVLSGAARADDSRHDLVLSTLQKHRLEVRVIGALKFCEKPGLASSILQKVTDTVLSDLIQAKDPQLEEHTRMLIQAVDVSSVGVATGLSISQMEASKKKSFCSMSMDLADATLSNKEVAQ